jgi:hypothetical protein
MRLDDLKMNSLCNSKLAVVSGLLASVECSVSTMATSSNVRLNQSKKTRIDQSESSTEGSTVTYMQSVQRLTPISSLCRITPEL